MSKFDLFRTRMANEEVCRQKFETRFITDGAAPITIHILRLEDDRDATMVFTDAEGPDAAIVFTPKQQTKENNLLKTDYYIWDNKMFFVYEDVIIPREVSYIKQKAYQCNAKVEILELADKDCFCLDDEECGGYFISSLRSYVDVDFQQKLNVTDKESPILIVPYKDWVKIGTKLSIGGKPWKIIDFDAITNPGIAYISLERDFFKKGSDVVEYNGANTIKAGIEYTVETQDGYFNSSSPLITKYKTANTVKFIVPYGIEECTIYIKTNGEIQERNYKVVI